MYNRCFWEPLHICVAWSRPASGTCEQVFQSRTLWDLLVDSLAAHRCLLIVPVLTSYFKPSLIIILELIIGWVFVILAVLPSIQMEVFSFLPGLSGFGYYLKAFEIIITEQPNFLYFFLCFTLANQLLNKSTVFCWTMSGITHFSQIFREMHQNQHLQHFLPSIELFFSIFLTEWMISVIEL